MAALVERLGDKFVFDASGCWLWTAVRDPAGYGRLTINKRPITAHRVLYELLVGPIPAGLQIDHLCRVRNCVNPAHLETVTQRENVLRGNGRTAENARKTHCPKGHPYDAGNTRISKSGSRCCRACGRLRYREKSGTTAYRRWP